MPRTARLDAPGVLHHVMSDERILGDSAFVDSVISQSEEQYERRDKLKRQGFDLDRIAGRVVEVSLRYGTG